MKMLTKIRHYLNKKIKFFPQVMILQTLIVTVGPILPHNLQLHLAV